MIKKPTGYDDAPVYGDYEKLPLGGHICQIKTVRTDLFEWGNVLILAFDIAEGSPSDGFYQRNFQTQQQENRKWKGTYRITIPPEIPTDEKDEKSISIFKTAIKSIEESNPGYFWNWDEMTLKGKIFGGVFGRKEYSFNGHHGFYTECRFIRTAEEIKKGVEVPEDKLLSEGKKTSNTVQNGYEEIPIPADDDLPF
jgi:hypothetical protein